jgi:hypothetical protein
LNIRSLKLWHVAAQEFPCLEVRRQAIEQKQENGARETEAAQSKDKSRVEDKSEDRDRDRDEDRERDEG